MAKLFLQERINWTRNRWSDLGLSLPEGAAARLEDQVRLATRTVELLSAEGLWAKALYGHLAQTSNLGFRRAPGRKLDQTPVDVVNGFLDHGNYLAYGYASVALHGLGISFAFPLLHGKTRRGALVFDVADLVKDGWVMPLAFQHGCLGSSKQEFRSAILEQGQNWNVLDHLFTFLSSAIKKVL